MGKDTNKTKSDFLGVNHSTAQSKLRKLIIFNLVIQTGNDTCFKCGIKFDSPNDFSIEHKIPWLHNDPALFWDITNIAFSHLSCNRPDRIFNKREWPEGQAWCTGHKEYHSTDEFTLNRSKSRGYEDYCKQFRNAWGVDKIRMREKRAKNKNYGR